MLTAIRTILADLKRADDFQGQPMKAALNQIAHALLIGGLMALPVVWALGLSVLIPPVVGATYHFVWERLIQRGSLRRDSLMDSLNVAAGAYAWVGAIYHPATGMAALLVWLPVWAIIYREAME